MEVAMAKGEDWTWPERAPRHARYNADRRENQVPVTPTHFPARLRLPSSSPPSGAGPPWRPQIPFLTRTTGESPGSRRASW